MYTGIKVKDNIIEGIKARLRGKLERQEADIRIDELRNIGRIRQEENREIVKKRIDEFVSIEGMVNTESLMREWFPEIKADIFISHSSADESDVHLMVGFFERELGLKVFVDSLVWGYSGNLLRELNDKYANIGYGYNYEAAMWLSSNVNLMLNTALNKMIDKTECLLFFNTPNSVKSSDGDKDDGDKSNSPWIYSELWMADTMRKEKPERYMKKAFGESATIEFSLGFELTFEYELPKSLIELKSEKLEEWLDNNDTGVKALDNLYDILEIRKKNENKEGN